MYISEVRNLDLANMFIRLLCIVGVFALSSWAGVPHPSYRRSPCVDEKKSKVCEYQLQPQLCYNSKNEQTCCASCQKYHTGDVLCPYGDRNTLIERDGGKYTCSSYVAWYGSSRCKDAYFAYQCCKTCANAKK